MNYLTDAELLLQEIGISEPDEIDLEVIAWHVGAIIKERTLDGCEARIVGVNDKAIITVNSLSQFERNRFSVGHEIGHWNKHRGKTLICRKEEIGNAKKDSKLIEQEADSFASNLLLPNYILKRYLESHKKLTLETVKNIKEIFQTSLSATAIALVERGKWPAMLICNGKHGRKWFTRYHSLTKKWFPKKEIDAQSSALEILYGDERYQQNPKKIDARYWFDDMDAYGQNLYEQSVKISNDEILTLLIFC